ncbi:hypothetical protein AAFN85_06815 [Mucilaginibacter sp. CAU 1740]|uniref:hypothetical protein n=1 Tax=Mucilaginibacter sp. CAU 1740 TaxID=3140365 RepID=UPI00325B4E1E
MGASYSCIITKEKVNIPASVPHFYKGDILTIPVNCGYWAVISFLDLFESGKLDGIDEQSDSVFKSGSESKDPLSVLYVLKQTDLTLRRFMLLYYSEWADVPDDVSYAVFDKGSILSETKTTSMDGAGSVSAFDYMGIDWSNVYRKDYFHEASDEYFRLLDDQKRL